MWSASQLFSAPFQLFAEFAEFSLQLFVFFAECLNFSAWFFAFWRFPGIVRGP
jgi:hypothetical protein